jgi:hypothetical protein
MTGYARISRFSLSLIGFAAVTAGSLVTSRAHAECGDYVFVARQANHHAFGTRAFAHVQSRDVVHGSDSTGQQRNQPCVGSACQRRLPVPLPLTTAVSFGAPQWLCLTHYTATEQDLWFPNAVIPDVAIPGFAAEPLDPPPR